MDLFVAQGTKNARFDPLVEKILFKTDLRLIIFIKIRIIVYGNNLSKLKLFCSNSF